MFDFWSYAISIVIKEIPLLHPYVLPNELTLPFPKGVQGLLKLTLGLIHLYKVLVHQIYALWPQFLLVIQDGI